DRVVLPLVEEARGVLAGGARHRAERMADEVNVLLDARELGAHSEELGLTHVLSSPGVKPRKRTSRAAQSAGKNCFFALFSSRSIGLPFKLGVPAPMMRLTRTRWR